MRTLRSGGKSVWYSVGEIIAFCVCAFSRESCVSTASHSYSWNMSAHLHLIFLSRICGHYIWIENINQWKSVWINVSKVRSVMHKTNNNKYIEYHVYTIMITYIEIFIQCFQSSIENNSSFWNKPSILMNNEMHWPDRWFYTSYVKCHIFNI